MSREERAVFSDGIYAHDLHHQIKLHTPRENGDHIIYFDCENLWEFLIWLRLRGWLSDEALERLKTHPAGPEELKEDDLGGLEDQE
jgi:hypothetical protein